MAVVQLAGGVLLALLLWNLCKLTLRTIFGIVGLTIVISVVFPGLLLILGGLTFIGIGLLATLGLLVLLSALLQGR